MKDDMLKYLAECNATDDVFVVADKARSEESNKKNSISQHYNKGNRGRGADKLKFYLMPFVCIMLFGFPFGTIGNVVSTLCRFVAPAFFILSGFFVLGTDREVRLEKIKRAIKRSGLFFFSMFAVYLFLNVIINTINGTDWISQVFRLRTAFEFFVFDLWPFKIGDNIWFIESLFFSYIIFFILDKIRLLRAYKLLLFIFVVFMLVTGEFAGVVGFDFLGYSYIPGGVLTRAIPYMLIGMFIREKADSVLQIPKWIYIPLAFCGLALAFMEIEVLRKYVEHVYTGHMIGFGITAIALCCFALASPRSRRSFTVIHGRHYSRRIYFMCHMVAYGLTLIAASISAGFAGAVSEYIGILTYIVSLLIAFIFGIIRNRLIGGNKPIKKKGAYIDGFMDS